MTREGHALERDEAGRLGAATLLEDAMLELLGRATLIADPVAAPRPRGRIEGPPAGEQWVKIYVPTWATNRAKDFGELWRLAELPSAGPDDLLELRCRFVFDRPASHYGTGRNAGVVKPQCRTRRPTAQGGRGSYGGDLDNLLKLVMDGLNGIAYPDDGRIVRVAADKLFLDQAGVERPQTELELFRILG